MAKRDTIERLLSSDQFALLDEQAKAEIIAQELELEKAAGELIGAAEQQLVNQFGITAAIARDALYDAASPPEPPPRSSLFIPRHPVLAPALSVLALVCCVYAAVRLVGWLMNLLPR